MRKTALIIIVLVLLCPVCMAKTGTGAASGQKPNAEDKVDKINHDLEEPIADRDKKIDEKINAAIGKASKELNDRLDRVVSYGAIGLSGLLVMILIVAIVLFRKVASRRHRKQGDGVYLLNELNERIRRCEGMCGDLYRDINDMERRQKIQDVAQKARGAVQNENITTTPHHKSKVEGEDKTPDSITKGKTRKVKYPQRSITKSGFVDELSDDQGNSYFVFYIDGDHAQFGFCGDDIERAKANRTELENVCEIFGSSVNAKTIKNVKPGVAILKDGKWVVREKAQIKFA